ncbi:DUF4129 domain-containing protein [Spirosoma rhododendri]|uniref:DUF4129 domain-containing protein n=1 Tax=Spirosoma rhododendri TaxID=2728024 RepID=A0A7L5DQU4_9BACT|nr:DUF4129 domain-containing protein [Spirosoma rhododendri]QJD78347.1 DUF4129 domain-containing protein [Spirosoma rhododendri]
MRVISDRRVRSANRLVAYLCCLLLIIGVGSVCAQPGKAPDDRGAVVVRRPAAAQLRDLQRSQAYQYDNEPPPPDDSLGRFLYYYWRQFMRLFNSKAYDDYGQYVLLAVLIGVVFYLLRKANYLDFLFPRQSQSSQLDYESSPEDIQGIDFGTAISQAIDGKQYRLAVRLLYLQTLKRLTDAQLIRYQREKTNRQYVYELAGTPHQRGFERLTQQFDYVWYGNAAIDSDQFARLQADFRAFQLLNIHQSLS